LQADEPVCRRRIEDRSYSLGAQEQGESDEKREEDGNRQRRHSAARARPEAAVDGKPPYDRQPSREGDGDDEPHLDARAGIEVRAREAEP
jgi:hypothetical protein